MPPAQSCGVRLRMGLTPAPRQGIHLKLDRALAHLQLEEDSMGLAVIRGRGLAGQRQDGLGIGWVYAGRPQ